MPPEFYAGFFLGVLATLSAVAVIGILLLIVEAYILLLSALATIDQPMCSECSGFNCPERKIKQ